MQKYVPLNPPPGLYKNGTKYQAKNRWYDANLIRFVNGTIGPIGGWRRVQDDAGANVAALAGIPRGAIAWRSDSNDVYMGFGTNTKLYSLAGGVLTDITPAGFVAGRADTGFASATGAYGAGTYGSGAYGTGSATASLLLADTWQLDVFGQYLIANCTSDKKLYLWPLAGLPTVPAGAPTCRAVVVTPERFIFALGAAGVVRRVQWPSQESTTDWTPSSSNTAGDFDLATNGALMCGRRTKSETLLWTDCDLHRATYIGGTLVYSFNQVADKCGIVGPNAVAMAGDVAYWMGRKEFYRYDGFVKEVPCDVADYVFGDINELQICKVFATTTSQYGEVTWYYASAGSTEIDRYVTYNCREGHWTVGTLTRTAGFDAGAATNPVLLTSAGLIYEHEVNQDRGTAVPYLESGPCEIGDGDRIAEIKELVPDEKTLGDVQAKIYSALYPTAAETLNGPYSLANPTSVRITARQVRIRLDEVRQTGWRVGILRAGVGEGSRR